MVQNGMYLLQVTQGLQDLKERSHGGDMLRNPETPGKAEPLAAEEGGGRFRSQTSTDRASETRHKIATQAAGHKRGGAREREGRGGSRKTRGGRWPPWAALRPNSQYPQLTGVVPDLGAAGKLGPGHGNATAGPQCSCPGPATAQGARAPGGSHRGLGAGDAAAGTRTISGLRVSGPLTLGVQAPASHKATGPGTLRKPRQRRKAATDPKMAGSATTDAQLNAPPPRTP